MGEKRAILSLKFNEEESLRLDEYLFKAGAFSSRSKAANAIKEKEVTVNGKSVKAHFLLSKGDNISYLEEAEKESNAQPQDIPIEIVYEDDDILVVNKPAGLVVHPSNGHSDGTLVNAILFHQEDISGGNDKTRPGIVHRIDKDTSGLLAIAKNDFAYAGLQSQLADHSMNREYLAIVVGNIDEDDGKIIAPIGRDRSIGKRNAVDLKNGKEAITYFHVEKRWRKKGYCLLSCRLLTGRTHQIRVHLDYIGHPVVGDPLYGRNNKALYDNGQLLHAYKLSLNHPRSGKRMEFTAPIPAHFQKVLDELDLD